jgi:hypothetical protein
LASTIFCTISFSSIATPMYWVMSPFISNMLHTISIPPTWRSIK